MNVTGEVTDPFDIIGHQVVSGYQRAWTSSTQVSDMSTIFGRPSGNQTKSLNRNGIIL